MSETAATPEAETSEMSYDTYRRAVSESKKYKRQLEEVQAQLNELNELKKKAEEQELAIKGEYKQKYETLKAQYEAETKKAGTLSEQLREYKEMIAKDIPDEIKETFDIETLTIKQIQVLAEKSVVKTPPNSMGAETTKQQGEPLDISAMTTEQIINLAVTNPKAYNELFIKRKK